MRASRWVIVCFCFVGSLSGVWKGFDGTPIFSCPGHVERYHLSILVLVLIRTILFVSCRKFCLSCWKSFVCLFLEKVVSVCSVVKFCCIVCLVGKFFLFLERVVAPCFVENFVCVFWCVHKCCCKHGTETERGQIVLLSVLPAVVSHYCCPGCIYGQDSELISELFGCWIWVSKSLVVFWVWITLKLSHAVFFFFSKSVSRVGLWLSLHWTQAF